jgi:transcriptional regulator with XRE-family HTH domain
MKLTDTTNIKAGNGRSPNGIRLGEVVRNARSDLGISIRQLARAVGVHHSSIARLEAGDHQEPKPPLLQRLSRVLEIDERDLFALAGPEAYEALPAFTPYLRAKYDISDQSARAPEDHFNYIRDRYDVKPRQTVKLETPPKIDPAMRPSTEDHPAYQGPRPVPTAYQPK